MLEHLTLDQLRLFVCAAEEGSFSAAGRRLNRVQSAVSYGISNLEESLGVQLFTRAGRRPELTRSGRALLQDVQQVFAGINQLRTRAAGMTKGLEPEVALVVDAIVPAGLLVECCRTFRKEFSAISLRIHTEVLGSVAALVLDGTCQLGISGPIGADAKALHRRFLAHVALVPVAAAGHPLAKLEGTLPSSAVRDHTQVVITERSHPHGGDQAVLSDSTWRVADAATKLELIRAGLGWGNLPVEMVRDGLQTGALVRLVLEEWGPDPLLAPLYSIVRVDVPPGPAGQWFLERLDEICGAYEGVTCPQRAGRRKPSRRKPARKRSSRTRK